MNDVYTCEGCGRRFEKTRSDDVAYAEAQARWLDKIEPMPEAAIVCDDCHAAMLEWAARQGIL